VNQGSGEREPLLPTAGKLTGKLRAAILQAEALEATSFQFFEDAKPVLSTLGPRERIIE